MGLSILIPVRPLHLGKSRLAGIMTRLDRESLCAWMFRRTVNLALQVAPTFVITCDNVILDSIAHSRDSRLQCIDEGRPLGLNEALDLGRASVPHSSLLILPIDLVRLDLSTLLAASRIDCVTIAPDLRRCGTNLLHLPVGLAPTFRFKYGANSMLAHARESSRLGAKPRFIYPSGAAFDIDLPEDVRQIQCGEFAGIDPLINRLTRGIR